ncbi:MAG: HAD family phosphatase [Ruminococcaceae bacterium]|nr:HAD family phosphatase [Oscillospiraceae bacterium]
MLKDIKGAIFDMDGTLVDSLMVWDVLWEKFGVKFLNREGFRPSKEDDKLVRTKTLQDAMDHIHSVYNLGHSGEELLDSANEMMRNFYSNDVELKKGVLEFLAYCYDKGIKMCIASATDISLIKLAIDHLKIGKYFVKILSCAAIGKGKDQPDIYIKAQECLGTKTEETCVFEDSHIAIDTADKLGMKTVGIYDQYNYGQEEMKRIATVYIAEGETLKKLIDHNCI